MTAISPGAPAPSMPSFDVPQGACDTHVHVMGPYDRFPLAADRLYTVPEAPMRDLLAMLKVMKLERVIVAHPSAFGPDVRVTLNAVEQLGERGRATIALDPKATRDQLRTFDRLGVRGVRLAKVLGWEATSDTLKVIADRIVEFGWHIAIWPADLPELYRLRTLSENHDVRIVLDHLACHCWRPNDGTEQEGFSLLRAMLKSKRIWLKLSGMYRASPNRFPWDELVPFGQKLVEECSDQLLWASDWPHVGLHTDNMPRSHELLNWLVEIGCDAATRKQILVDNPRKVYGFADRN